MDKGTVGIVGSGLIGKSWSMLFMSAGYKVRLYDAIPGTVQAALKDIKSQMEKLEADGMLRGKLTSKEQLTLISEAPTLAECIKGAIHVQECIPESLDFKRKIFQEMDKLVEGNTVLSSSSSAIPCSKFTEDLKHRSQCIISHPINPPYLMPLVELVPAPWTNPDVVKRTRSLMVDIGQSPVTLKKEIAGFLQPRIQYAIIQEGLKLIKDDVMSVSDLDKVMTEGLGYRYAFMGPFETAHLNAEGFGDYLAKYKDMIYDVSCDSGPPVPMSPENDTIQEVNRQLCEITPLDNLVEKRKWRDERLARLAQLRSDKD